MAVHFKKEFQVRFREADPAGIGYFAHVFSFAHDAFEDFIVAAGFHWKEWFLTKEYIVPIRHTECSFLKPFLPGENYQISVSVAKLGDSSFQMKYLFLQGPHQHATVLMTHVFLDAKSKGKMSIPEIVRNRLKVYLDAEEN